MPLLPPIISFLFLFLFSLHLRATLSDQTSGDLCAGRRIHIRQLPSRFNTDLLRLCSSFPISDSGPFCAYLANHGLGARTHNRSLSWYRTDPRLLEPLFHRRLQLDYPCLVSSPSAADAIFLPYYASLDALPFLYSPALFNFSSLHGVSLSRFLHRDNPSLLTHRYGHDHFLILSGPAWDFNQDPAADPDSWGTSFLKLPDFINFTVLTLESRPWPWQDHAVPHPTSFHPSSLHRLSSWLSRAERSRRSKLMLFAGGGGAPSPTSRPNIRTAIYTECTNRTDLCTLVDCSAGICTHDPIRYMLPMLKTRFCLQPPGDTPTRRSTFDAIIAGCIPVFFEEASARRQYGWHLPRSKYDEFSVLIPKEEVVFSGVRISDVLSAVPEERVRRMQKRVLEMAPRVMYSRPGSREEMKGVSDAFDIAVDGVLRRVRRRVRAIEEGDPDQIYYIDDDDEED